MNELATVLNRRIATSGPLGLGDYMAECLCHPSYGYYMSRDPFGVTGDFITAPEISQMFGELLGLWAANLWQQMGTPEKIHLVELGPGRGTLMNDALRAVRGLSGFINALEVHLIEISPVLKAKQKETLSAVPVALHWHDSIHSLPEGPVIVLANEFFDALPIRQFELSPKGWAERCVDCDEADETFRYVLKKDEAARAFIPETLSATANPGDIFEICLAQASIAQTLGERVTQQGGAVLVLDYGYTKTAFGETFQALENHKFVDPLARPGNADLTAHVNFETLGNSFADGGAKVFGPTPQGLFLERLGISQRAQFLLERAREDQRESLIAAHRRLCHPDEMGTLFKVLCAQSPGLGIPAGFEGDE